MGTVEARQGANLHDRAALRVLEAKASEHLGGDGFALMSRAGEAAWRLLLSGWAGAQRIVVACGPGNNGGDGYVLALHALQSGLEVTALQMPGHAPATPLARRACDAYVQAGGAVTVFEGRLPAADVIVDALFGIGLSRALNGAAAAMAGAINAAGVPVLALDAPSGVDTETGAVPGVAVQADQTVQFIAAHAGLATGPALDHVGRLVVASLDLPASVFEGVAPVARRLRADDLQGRFEPRRRNAHKGDSGFLLCIGGEHGTGGAVLLAAEAALRSGAGLVGVATRAAHVPAMLARRPEVMAQGVDGAATLRPLIDRAGIVAIGPGLGQAAWGSALFGVALASGKPLVVDADGLNLLAKGGQALPSDAILTPHPGEAARLLQTDAAAVQADRLGAARRLCKAFGCVVVLKGAGTVVAAPGELPLVIAAGNPGMASGGTGDVLTGVIAALRAQGRKAFDAAATGALLHAAAGDLAAQGPGERGLLASDLFPHLRAQVNP